MFWEVESVESDNLIIYSFTPVFSFSLNSLNLNLRDDGLPLVR